MISYDVAMDLARAANAMCDARLARKRAAKALKSAREAERVYPDPATIELRRTAEDEYKIATDAHEQAATKYHTAAHKAHVPPRPGECGGDDI